MTDFGTSARNFIYRNASIFVVASFTLFNDIVCDAMLRAFLYSVRSLLSFEFIALHFSKSLLRIKPAYNIPSRRVARIFWGGGGGAYLKNRDQIMNVLNDTLC